MSGLRGSSVCSKARSLFFTRPEFEGYMATVMNKLPNWTSKQAAAKLEAFTIAGCDVSGTTLPAMS
jgi:hypothetical protein